MHTFARHTHNQSQETPAKGTRGRILNLGWRYDLFEWFLDTFLLRGKLRELRQRAADLARIQPGESVLDVGCGTGTLAIGVQQRVGSQGQVLGIDPGEQQIARARAKAARRNLPIDFRVGVIEALDFPEHTFDAVLSTIMLHHLPDDLKRRGLAEIARVLKPGGRLVIVDFKRPQEHQNQPVPVGSTEDLPALVTEVGFSRVETEEMPFPLFHSGIIFVKAHKS